MSSGGLRLDDHGFVTVGGVLAARWLAVDRHVARLEPRLQAAAGKLRRQGRDRLVEALAARVRRQLERNRGQVGARLGRAERDIGLVVKLDIEWRARRCGFRRIMRWS